MSAGSADAKRRYVLCGLGIAIVAQSAGGDGLRLIDIRRLSPSSKFHIGVRQPEFVSAAARSVITLLASKALERLSPSGAKPALIK